MKKNVLFKRRTTETTTINAHIDLERVKISADVNIRPMLYFMLEFSKFDASSHILDTFATQTSMYIQHYKAAAEKEMIISS